MLQGWGYHRHYTNSWLLASLFWRGSLEMFRKTDTTTRRVWPNFRRWEVCVRALAAGAALSAMAAVSGARGQVVPLASDSCSTGCTSDIEDDSAIAWEAADDQAALSLTGRGPSHDPLLFDRETVPEVLAAGLPSALLSNKKPGTQDSSSFEYLFTHPDEIGAPGLFLSVASLTGQLTLADILSGSHDFFSEALTGEAPTPLDMSVMGARIGQPRANFSTDSVVTSRKKAKRSTSPSTDLSLPSFSTDLSLPSFPTDLSLPSPQ